MLFSDIPVITSSEFGKQYACKPFNSKVCHISSNYKKFWLSTLFVGISGQLLYVTSLNSHILFQVFWRSCMKSRFQFCLTENILLAYCFWDNVVEWNKSPKVSTFIMLSFLKGLYCLYSGSVFFFLCQQLLYSGFFA